MLRVREALLLSVVLFQTESRVSHPELQVPFAGRCSSASSLRLKGGDDDAGSSSQKKMPSKEEVYAFVAQKKVHCRGLRSISKRSKNRENGNIAHNPALLAWEFLLGTGRYGYYPGQRFIRTGLSEEESTPELPEAAYRAPGLPQETLLAPQKVCWGAVSSWWSHTSTGTNESGKDAVISHH
eukprot:756415-Hanusia_phi.AAC.2